MTQKERINHVVSAMVIAFQDREKEMAPDDGALSPRDTGPYIVILNCVNQTLFATDNLPNVERWRARAVGVCLKENSDLERLFSNIPKDRLARNFRSCIVL